MKYLNGLIRMSLRSLAKDNGWSVGHIGQTDNTQYRGKMQINFCSDHVMLWTNIKDKGEGDVIKITYDEMNDDRMCAIIHTLICNTE